jgi:hypothetical protein
LTIRNRWGQAALVGLIAVQLHAAVVWDIEMWRDLFSAKHQDFAGVIDASTHVGTITAVVSGVRRTG